AWGRALVRMELQVTPTTTPMAAWLESAWLARYLDRQLSGDEAAWFEAYLLDKPELLGMVEVDNALRDGLAVEVVALRSEVDSGRQREAGSDVGEVLAANTTSSFEHTPKLRSAAISRFPARVGVAASLVLGLGIGWMSQHALVSRHEAENLIANPTRVVFDTMRGTPSAPEIERADSRSPYVLVEVAVPPGAEAVTLDVGGPTRTALSPSAEGFVSFLIARVEIGPLKKAVVRYSIGGSEKTRDIPLFQLERSDKR
ncbi:MAG: hypothetical protein ABIO49_10960, partial [Dokdonella sp.]